VNAAAGARGDYTGTGRCVGSEKKKQRVNGHGADTKARRCVQGESPALKLMHILCYDLSAIRGQRTRLVKQKTGAGKLFPGFLF